MEPSEIEIAIREAKKRIGLKPVTLEDLERITNINKVKGEECLHHAAIEFLTEELKMDNTEIENLGKFKISLKDDVNNDKIYLHFSDESSCGYINTKAAICQNTNINTFPFIPPHLFKRFNDLSQNTFLARQEDKRLKAKICLGTSDLELRAKHKDITD